MKVVYTAFSDGRGGFTLAHFSAFSEISLMRESFANCLCVAGPTVERNVASGLEARKLPRADIRERAEAALDLVGLAEYAKRRLGITTIFVARDQEEALTACHRVAVMEAGVIRQVGTPMELFDFPVNRFVAQFVGSVNLFAGTFHREGGASIAPGSAGDARRAGHGAPARECVESPARRIVP